MNLCNRLLPLAAYLLAAIFTSAQSPVPTDNPLTGAACLQGIAPAWTTRLAWHRVIDMSTYARHLPNDFSRFEAARDELHALGGGVLYYPAGTYDFSDRPADGPQGKALLLRSGIILRGQAPSQGDPGQTSATSLPTKFYFGFATKPGVAPTLVGEVPRDWNFIGLGPDRSKGETVANVNDVGVVHIHLIGGVIFWGFALDGDGVTTWSQSGAWKSGLVKPDWAQRVADYTFPLDYFAGSSSSRRVLGAGTGRLVYGCIVEDGGPLNSAVMEGRTNGKNFGQDGYWLQKFGARIQVYGSDVLIAGNHLPKSRRGFLYRQTVGHNPAQSNDSSRWQNQEQTVYFNYNCVTGIDVNKELLNPYADKDQLYFAENVAVIGNRVYNHGRKGFNVSGRWAVVRHNTNWRDYLGSVVPEDSGPASGLSYYLTLDGYVQCKPGGPGDISDSLSRAFDLAGGPLWVDGNAYGGALGDTGSDGNDGEGILCQAHGGTQVYSWAVTHNVGGSGYMAGYDVNQYGSLWAWNQTVGKTGNLKAGQMYDAAVVGNLGGTTAITGDLPVYTQDAGPPAAPIGVKTAVEGSRIAIRWQDGGPLECGYQVERSIAGRAWQVVALRPRQEQRHAANPPQWVDGLAPADVEIRYRVGALAGDGTVIYAEPTPALSLAKPPSALLEVNRTVLTRRETDWENAYQNRIAQLANATTWKIGSGNGDPDVGKRDWPALLAEMWKVRTNPAALQAYINVQGKTLINSEYAGSFYKPFSVPGYTFYYFHFRQYAPEVFLPADQLAAARQIEWPYLTREDNRMDPIYGQTEFNSENFNWMARLGGLQWAYELPDTDLGLYQYNWQAGQPKGMARAYFRNYMDNWTKALFCAGRVEWNSSNYWGYTFQPILTLLEHPPSDPTVPSLRSKIERQALAGADWMLLEAALHYLDGFTGGPDVRAKDKPHLPFHGSIWPYAYLYFAEEGHLPTFSVAQMQSRLERNLVGWFPWSSYRPLRVLQAIAQRRYRMPVEIHSAKPFYHLDHDNYASWAGEGSYQDWKASKTAAEQAHRSGFRFEFETIYQDTGYLLASLATYRPNGSLDFFSEQCLFRLLVQGSDSGALQVIGNTGFSATPARRDPYEQIAQHGNVVLRVLKNPDAGQNLFWYALPIRSTRVLEGHRLYADLGHGVYAAFLPLGQPEATNMPYDDGAGGHHRYQWKFPADEFAAIVLEVGTAREYGNFASFRTALQSYAPTLSAPNEASYQSASGRHLRVRWSGVARDYPLTNNGGSILSLAGLVPEVWRDGKKVDYQKWHCYEVVEGEEIVRQEWGSGILRLQADGEAVQIQVDLLTGEARFFELAPPTALPFVQLLLLQDRTTEGTLEPLRWCLQRTPTDTAPLAVRLRQEGTADSADIVFTPDITSGLVTIPAGTNAVEITAHALQDDIAEAEETVVLSVLSDSSYQILSSPLSRGTINDHTNPFTLWQQAHFSPEEVISGAASATQDCDADGLPNYLEFAFGGDPHKAEILSSFLHLTIEHNSSDNRLSLSFDRWDAPQSPQLWWSSDAEVWEEKLPAPGESWEPWQRGWKGSFFMPVGPLLLRVSTTLDP